MQAVLTSRNKEYIDVNGCEQVTRKFRAIYFGRLEKVIKTYNIKKLIFKIPKGNFRKKNKRYYYKRKSIFNRKTLLGKVFQNLRRNKTKSSILGLVLILALLVFQSNLIPRIIYPYPYKQIINKYALEYNTDALLILSVIKAESSFLPFSYSNKGAVGLMQLMPDTAKEISDKTGEDYSHIDLKDPETNIRYGSMYLASLNKQYDGNTVLTLAAYNAGIGHVNEWLTTTDLAYNNYSIKDIPFPETRAYVEKVLKYYHEYSGLYLVKP